MKPNFIYFEAEKILPSLDNYSRALSLVAQEKLILDSEYLPVIEAAHRGDLPSICEMATLFVSGTTGLPRNYKIARHYINVLKEYWEDNPGSHLQALIQSGILEYEFGNLESAKSEFVQAAKIMVNLAPPEKWNYEVFEYLQKLSFLEMNNEGDF